MGAARNRSSSPKWSRVWAGVSTAGPERADESSGLPWRPPAFRAIRRRTVQRGRVAGHQPAALAHEFPDIRERATSGQIRNVGQVQHLVRRQLLRIVQQALVHRGDLHVPVQQRRESPERRACARPSSTTSPRLRMSRRVPVSVYHRRVRVIVETPRIPVRAAFRTPNGYSTKRRLAACLHVAPRQRQNRRAAEHRPW